MYESAKSCRLAEAHQLFSALNRYDGAISQCIGQLRTGALTLEPIGPRVAPRLGKCRRCASFADDHRGYADAQFETG
jgi:hypothetical protein